MKAHLVFHWCLYNKYCLFLVIVIVIFFGFEYIRDYYTHHSKHVKKAKTEKKNEKHIPTCKKLTYCFHFNILVVLENIHTPQQNIF